MVDRRDLAPEFKTGGTVDGFHPRPHLGQLAFELDTPTVAVDGFRDMIVRQTGPNMSDEVARTAHAAKVAAGGYNALHLFAADQNPSQTTIVPAPGESL
jgi:hypothetical protein